MQHKHLFPQKVVPEAVSGIINKKEVGPRYGLLLTASGNVYLPGQIKLGIEKASCVIIGINAIETAVA